MIYILIVLMIAIGDYLIKDYIEKHKELGGRQEILGGRVILRRHHNEGAFLNFMNENKEILKIISGTLLTLFSLIFLLLLPRKGKKMLKLGLALALGGSISNVTDRMKRGYVVDYFSFNCKKLKNIIFNLSDMAIFLGSALTLLSTLFSSESDAD
ncbi:signal peptidase II [Anaerotaenia torta]|uniref:signal peptidase II n=1 Tax=Anaerotaenia torta TaxID=433293 RepID=UPI003D19C00F